MVYQFFICAADSTALIPPGMMPLGSNEIYQETIPSACLPLAMSQEKVCFYSVFRLAFLTFIFLLLILVYIMKVLSWACRGLVNARTRQKIVNLSRFNKFDILFLFETKVQSVSLNLVNGS